MVAATEHRIIKTPAGVIGNRVIFLLLIIVLALFFILDILVGSVNIPYDEIIRIIKGEGEPQFSMIILKFRLPKAITAVLAGMALSVSGLQMQTIFRNPMAGPFVLGVSSGASLGVALVILGFSSFMPAGNSAAAGNWLIILSACAGAGAIMLLIMFIATRVRDILTVLILGIMIAGGISAFVTILQYFTSESLLKAYVIWTMGSLGNLTTSQLRILIVAIFIGLSVSAFTMKILNALLLGETYATSIGVNVRVSRILIFLSTSILAGGVTAFCGPIGFIGIAVPHIARMIFRTSDHKVLLPAAMLIGASLMLLSDLISQLPGSDKVLPVNSITSLIGIPIVIWVILRGRKINSTIN